MIDIAVMLLPQPDSPTRPSVSPWSILSDTPSTARTSDLRCRMYVLRSLISRTGVAKKRGSLLSASGRIWVAPEYRCGCGRHSGFMRGTGSDREHSIAFLGLEALNLEALARKPRRQRVRSQVPLHHEVGVGAGLQEGQPSVQQVVQRSFADPDGWVRVDGGEPNVGRHLVREAGDDIGGLGGGGVGPRQLERSFIDVDSPHPCRWRAPRQRDGDGTVAGAEIQQIALGRGEGGLFEQRQGSEVDPPRSEYATVALELDREITHVQVDRARLRGGFGHGIEGV